MRLKVKWVPTGFFTGVCSTANVPSVSSINRILRNRAAERAAVEYTKIASRSMLNLYPQLWRMHESRDYTSRLQLPEPPSVKEIERFSRSESPLHGKYTYIIWTST